MKNIISFSIFSGLVFLRPLYSGEDLWTSIGGPPGGYSRAADFCPPPFTEIYASSDSFLYISTDNGQTWQITGHPQTEFNDIKIGRRGTTYCIFTATSNGIYRCVNGRPWWLTNWTEPTEKLAIDKSNCSYIYAISGGRIIRSTNLGYSWFEITPQPPNNWLRIEIDPFSPQTVYAGHLNAGVFVSYNAGVNWQLIGPDNGIYFIGKRIEDIDVSPRNSNVIFVVVRYIDAGEIGEIWRYRPIEGWQKILWSGNCENYDYLVISQTSPDTVFAFMCHPGISPVAISYDEGDSWAYCSNWWPHFHLMNMVSSPTTDGLFVLATLSGLVRSTSFLNPYSLTYQGLLPRYYVKTLATHQSNENLLLSKSEPYTPYEYFMWRTDNGGATWQPYPQIIPANEFPLDPKQIKFVSPDNQTVYLLADSSGYFRFFVSTDAGQTFVSTLNFELPPPYPPHIIGACYDLFNLNPNFVYALGNYGNTSYLWYTDDPYNPSSWEFVGSTLYAKNRCKIHPFNSNILFFGGKNGGFWKSIDGGSDFSSF